MIGKKILLAISLLSFGISAAFISVPENKSISGRESRFPANNELRQIAPFEKAGHIVDASSEQYVISLRKEITATDIPQVFINAMLLLEETPILLKNAELAMTAGKKSFLFADSPPAALLPLLPLDGSSRPSLYGNIRHAEALDLDGKPVRWRLSSSFLAGLSPPRPWLEYKETPPPKTKISKKPLPKSAQSYRGMVENFARRYGLNVSLVLAIIHSESNFSPTLVSSKSAMGLMQLLPSTASDEVHRFLYGKRGQIGFEDLQNPELNIRYGTAYLHILHTRYFPEIIDWEVREACVIAAYNLGPNRFIRLYGSSPSAAAQVINSMTHEEFFNDLNSRLPARETRNYVEKVRRLKNHYDASR